MSHITPINPSSMAPPAGAYSQAICHSGSGAWLHLSGQVGILPDGSLAQGIADQTHAVWKNIVTLLQAAGMDVSNLVRITTFVIHPDMIKPAGAIRKAYLGACRPASTAISVQALAHPDWLIEIDALAFCHDRER